MPEPDTTFPSENPETVVWELMTQMDMDPLTNLPNRRRGEEDLARHIQRSKQNNYGLAVIFIDADNFKPVNEHYGHGYGDSVLTDFSTALSQAFRPEDRLIRHGGDEFYVICPKFDTKLSREEIEKRVKAKIQETLAARVDFKSRPELKSIGATVGIALLREDDNAQSLIRRADEEMNKIKQQKHRQGYGE